MDDDQVSGISSDIRDPTRSTRKVRTGSAATVKSGECAAPVPAVHGDRRSKDAENVLPPAIESAGQVATLPSSQSMRLLSNPSYQDLLGFIVSLGAALLVLTLLVLLGWDTFRQTITIEPISVPKNFAEDDGFGPEVAARRLQDAIDKVLALADRPPATSERSVPSSTFGNKDADVYAIPGPKTTVIQQSDLPVITLPSIGSLNSFAVIIQSFLPQEKRAAISGEFTLFENKLSLVLRKNRHVVFSSIDTGDPKHPDALLDQAAVKLLDEVRPTLAAIIHNRNGNRERREGNREKAEAEYRQAIVLDPENSKWHYNLANVLRDLGKLNDAIAEYQIAIEYNPRDAAARAGLELVLNDQGRFDQAIMEYQKAITLEPRDADRYTNLGNAFLEQRKFDDAAAIYRKAITIDPANAGARNGLGLLFREEGRFADAVANYRVAIEHDPKDAGAHINLGNILHDQGKLDEAIQEYRQAIALGPTSAAHVGLGIILEEEGKRDEAAKQYREAISINSRNAAAHNNLGSVLEDSGDLDEAINEYEYAIRLDPSYTDPHGNLGNILMGQGKLVEAVDEYTKAIRLDSNDAALHVSLAKTLGAMRKFDYAEAEYREAIRLDPKDATTQYHLGTLLVDIASTAIPQDKAAKLLKEACASMLTAAQLDPKGSAFDYVKAQQQIDGKLDGRGSCPPK